MKIKVGDKIWFEEEKQGYIIKAFDGRYAICTKPFNPKKTVIYTIVDFKKKIRGPDNLIFGIYDYGKQKDIEECLLDLTHTDKKTLEPIVGISHRRRIPLRIRKILTQEIKTVKSKRRKN